MFEIKKGNPVIGDLSKEDQDNYEYLMKEAKHRYPNTMTHILDMAIGYYLKNGDNNIEEDDDIHKYKTRYNEDVEEVFGSIEIIREADIPQEKKDRIDADNLKMKEALENREQNEELKENLYKVGVLSGIIAE